MFKTTFAALCILGMLSPALAAVTPDAPVDPTTAVTCQKDALPIAEAAAFYGEKGVIPIGEINDPTKFPTADPSEVGIDHPIAWIVMVDPKRNVVIGIPTDGTCIAVHGVILSRQNDEGQHVSE